MCLCVFEGDDGVAEGDDPKDPAKSLMLRVPSADICKFEWTWQVLSPGDMDKVWDSTGTMQSKYSVSIWSPRAGTSILGQNKVKFVAAKTMTGGLTWFIHLALLCGTCFLI